MKPGNINRRPLEGSRYFACRGEDVKWPTIRKAWLNDRAVDALREYATTRGRSIIFLAGTYKTNLNKWTEPPRSPIERAVFFEFLVKHPQVKGGIYVLIWIGDFHNGCIAHFGYQFPQMRCWEEVGGESAKEFFEQRTFRIYKDIVRLLYAHSEHQMDAEVAAFLENGDGKTKQEGRSNNSSTHNGNQSVAL